MFGHADDITLLARSKEQVETLFKAIKDILAENYKRIKEKSIIQNKSLNI